MSNTKHKAATNPKALELTVTPTRTEAQAVANAAIDSAANAAFAMDAFHANTVGSDVNLMALIESLRQSTDKAKGGDLSGLEAMLIGQATALQTIFTSLARRAMNQEYQKNLESFLGLALKAQAQSRATISALVDLKYPRQATFVKQANIANGPQQVNNGTMQAGTHSHATEIEPSQNELLEDASHGSTQMDTRAAPAPARSHSTVETMATVHRAAERKR